MANHYNITTKGMQPFMNALCFAWIFMWNRLQGFEAKPYYTHIRVLLSRVLFYLPLMDPA